MSLLSCTVERTMATEAKKSKKGGKKKVVVKKQRFTVDCSAPSEAEIFDISSFVSTPVTAPSRYMSDTMWSPSVLFFLPCSVWMCLCKALVGMNRES